jgi:hypothetical protein
MMKHKWHWAYKWFPAAECGWWNVLWVPCSWVVFGLVAILVALGFLDAGGYVTDAGERVAGTVWVILSAIYFLWTILSFPATKLYYRHGLTKESVGMIKRYESLPKEVQQRFPDTVEQIIQLEKDNDGGWSAHHWPDGKREYSPQKQLSDALGELVKAENERQRAMAEPGKQFNRQSAIDMAERMRDEVNITRTVTKELL